MLAPILRLTLIAALAALGSGCAAPAASPPAASPTAASPTASGTPSAEPSAAAPAASLNSCPAPRALASLTPLARLSGGPDDAVVTPAGDIWVSEHDGGHLVELSAAGAQLRSIADPLGPEGIEVLGDGTLLVAEQEPDRIDSFNPETGTFTRWLQLEAAAPDEGVDGLGIDGTTLLLPDSAGGRLLLVPIEPGGAAGTPSVLATGLGRPVSAWPLGDGSYVVAVENRPGLLRISAAGVSSALVQQASLDDVVARGGIVYATNLAADSLEAVDPRSGAQRTLVTGAPDPQGLALTAAGSLLLVDETADVVLSVPSCG